MEVTTEFLDAMAALANGNERIVIPANESHVYHHYDRATLPSFNLKIERNSRSFNYSVTVENCRNGDEANDLLAQAKAEIDMFIAANEQVG